MPIIGTVTHSSDGRFTGHLHTLLIQCPLAILPVRSALHEVRPDYRVLAGTLEIGSGWIREDEASGGRTVSLALAMPEFGPRRLYCQLVQSPADEDPERYGLRWLPVD